jgi:hypothetical protein
MIRIRPPEPGVTRAHNPALGGCKNLRWRALRSAQLADRLLGEHRKQGAVFERGEMAWSGETEAVAKTE